MAYYISLLVENGAYLAVFVVSMLGLYAINKGGKNIRGASLVSAGLLMYGIYGLLAFTGPGFTGSFFRDFSKVGVLNSITAVYFISFVLRAGVILVIAGIYQMATSRRA